MRVLVCARSDAASRNIRDRLVDAGGWSPEGTFRGAQVLRRAEARLVEIEGPGIHDEALGPDLHATDWDIQAVWVLSRHRAKSGHPSLTVHPVGNHGSADLGGRPQALPPAPARDLGAILRRLRARRDAAGLPHSVAYEATHHGPWLDLPALYVEIGSDDAWYGDTSSGHAVAGAILDVLDGQGAPAPGAPILVGVGGGHYVPRQTDLTLAGACDFGHLVPAHAVDAAEGEEVLRRAIAATPGCTGVYVHRKGLKGPQRQRVKDWMAALGQVPWTNAGTDD